MSNKISPIIFFLLETLKGTVKTPVVDLFRLNNLAATKTAFQPQTGTTSISVYIGSLPRGFKIFTPSGIVESVIEYGEDHKKHWPIFIG